MFKVTEMTPGDILAMVGTAPGSKATMDQEQFKSLLGEAMQGAGKTTGKDKPAKAGKNQETGGESELMDPGAAAAAIAAQQQPHSAPADDTQPAAQQTAEGTGQVAAVQATQAATVLDVVLDELLPQANEAQQGADILAVQATVIDMEAPEAIAMQAQTQVPAMVDEDANQERFDGMIGSAQQKLQDYQAEQPVQVQESETVEVEYLQRPGAQFEPQVVEADAADENDTVEQELPAETMADETVPAQTAKPTIVEAKVLEQRPMKEIPKEDRAVLEMREAPAAPEPKPVDDIRAERTPEPQQSQRSEIPMDQTDQIRAQVAENLSKTNMEFRMQLQPEELGKINVKMVIEGGRLAVEIMAAGTRTTDLLNRQVDSLISSLRLHTGMDIESVQVVNETATAESYMDGAFNMLNGEAQNGETGGQQGRGPATSGGADTAEQPTGNTQQHAPDTLLNYTI